MKLNSFELTEVPDSRLLMGFKFLKEKSDKTGICSVSELYNFAAVETLRHHFLGWGGDGEKEGEGSKTILYFSSMRCKFPNPSFYFNENYLDRKVPFGVHSFVNRWIFFLSTPNPANSHCESLQLLHPLRHIAKFAGPHKHTF